MLGPHTGSLYLLSSQNPIDDVNDSIFGRQVGLADPRIVDVQNVVFLLDVQGTTV